MIIANKSDKENSRQVEKSKGEKVWIAWIFSLLENHTQFTINKCLFSVPEQFGYEFDIPFYETSAKESHNIEQV